MRQISPICLMPRYGFRFWIDLEYEVLKFGTRQTRDDGLVGMPR